MLDKVLCECNLPNSGLDDGPWESELLADDLPRRPIGPAAVTHGWNWTVIWGLRSHSLCSVRGWCLSEPKGHLRNHLIRVMFRFDQE